MILDENQQKLQDLPTILSIDSSRVEDSPSEMSKSDERMQTNRRNRKNKTLSKFRSSAGIADDTSSLQDEIDDYDLDKSLNGDIPIIKGVDNLRKNSRKNLDR